jgi:hypothetical protein
LNDWPLNDWQLALATAVCLGVIIILLSAIALRTTRISRAEFARLQKDFKQLSEDVKGLIAAEQRRFLKELKTSKKDGDEPISGSRPSNAPFEQAPSLEMFVNQSPER